ncbi:uncharacterized protein LOC117119129 [Anneissia japonica]|uniref:uncharacterized protein LOC117119129 n=1 Tax=Anneissia japonica TaxID=1529436 RepID=UPI0014254D03|nr:uncharacterized protein LOC117119129 [Anneissia japonica]
MRTQFCSNMEKVFQMTTQENEVTETRDQQDSNISTPPRLMCPSSHSLKQQLFRLLLAFGILIWISSTAVMISFISSHRILINHLLAVEESNLQIRDSGKPKTYRGKVTYQHWGRESCSATAELVYKGVMAGGINKFLGGGVNYLCLPEQPSYGFTVPDIQVYMAPIGATVYRGLRNFSTMDHLHGYEAFCSVCLADQNAIFVMPAQSTCPSDWTLEYSGYLMGSRSNRKRTEFICVDVNSEGRDSTRNISSGLSEVFIAETHCDEGTTGGGLPCPPYKNGAELPCAVCTR